MANSERFGSWFPRNDNVRELRRTKTYKEEYARTERLYNSPLYAMRRILNEEDITEEIE